MQDPNYLTAYRQFTLDANEAQESALIEERKKAEEENATHELYAKIGPSLADFLPFPSWTVETQTAHGDIPAHHLYKLTVKIVFKP